MTRNPLSDLPPTRFLYSLTAATYALSLLYVSLLRILRNRLDLHAVLQLVGDISIITGLVYYFGGLGSSFSLLYLVVIAVGAILLPARVNLILANLAWICYATLMVAIVNDWIPPATVAATSFQHFYYSLVVHLLGFNTVALLVSYAAKSASRTQLALKRKEEDLAKLESFHRNVTNSLSSGLITTDPEGTVITINPAGERILDKTSVEVVGRPVFEIGVCSRQEWLSTSETTQVFGRRREESSRGVGENRVYLGYTVTSFQHAEGTESGFLVIFQDVSRFRLLEQQVRMTDRMAAIGELSAGIAHEIRNPLAAISGSVQMLSSSVDKGGSGAKLLDIILKESQRLDRTIEDFLKYARPKEKSAKPFDIANLLRENAQLLRNSDQVSEVHEVVVKLDPPSAQIVADRDQISQIFWNLARNALSAMPKGGRLLVAGTLDTSNYTIRFQDNGRGMTEEERRTMFHPFKTTFHGGSGLGMAIVYQLVQEHGGQLNVESELDHGTTVAIEIPLGEPAQLEAAGGL